MIRLESLPGKARAAAKLALGLGPARAASLRVAAARNHGLIVLYHRVGEPGSRSEDHVVPSVTDRVLRSHLEVLLALGPVVPLDELLHAARGTRPRFALTFDDDYPSHARAVLPVLQSLGVPATFFLSGRGLHGLPPFWFESLEALLAERGLPDVARELGLTAVSAAELAVACEVDPRLQRAVLEAAPVAADHLLEDEIRNLSRAGMEIGFHTLHHRRLTGLDHEALARAVVEGRERVASVIGRPVTSFAYPHGKSDPPAAEAVARAGYRLACTGRPGPVRPTSDPMLLPRWEPGGLTAAGFAAGVAVRLHRQA